MNNNMDKMFIAVCVGWGIALMVAVGLIAFGIWLSIQLLNKIPNPDILLPMINL